MPLPTCECVNGLPTQQQLGFIYCALLEILAGQGGGEITLAQISDLDASWIPPLQAPVGNFSVTASQISDATPFGLDVLTDAAIGASSGYLTVNTDDAVTVVPFASISIAASQISDATLTAVGFITNIAPPLTDGFLTIDVGGVFGNIDFGVTASQANPTQVDTDRGVVTVLS
jgi:hypothetical protein